VGICVSVGLTVAWFVWTVVRSDWDPATDRHKIDMIAEDLNRLAVISQAYATGEPVWSIKEKTCERERPKIVAFDGERWDRSWHRIYEWTLQLERMTPRQRRKKLLDAVAAAQAALQQGAEMAKHEDAELIYWARDCANSLAQPRIN
jgi:hypothetical protein